MSSGNTVVYVKGERNTEVQHREVVLGDILAVECSDRNVIKRIKPLKIVRISEKGPDRTVVSILKIIERIHQEIPGLQIQNEGETDLIITYEKPKKKSRFYQGIKVAGIAGITFIGSAFSMMSFNNDVAVTDMFSQIYELLTGKQSNGFTILEVTYCIGVLIGILTFFNHFGKKRFTSDPTPMEVEMRLYENDIQTTLVETYSRKEQEVDVD